MTGQERGTRYIRGHKVSDIPHRKPSEVWLAVGLVLWTTGTTGMFRLPSEAWGWVAGYSGLTILGILAVCVYVGRVVRHLAHRAGRPRRGGARPSITNYWPEEDAWDQS